MLPQQQITWWFLLSAVADLITSKIMTQTEYKRLCGEDKKQSDQPGLFPWWCPPYFVYRCINVSIAVLQPLACNIIQTKLYPWSWELNVYLIYLTVSILWVISLFYFNWFLFAVFISMIEFVLMCVVLISFSQFNETACILIVPCFIFVMFKFALSVIAALSYYELTSSSAANKLIPPSELSMSRTSLLSLSKQATN